VEYSEAFLRLTHETATIIFFKANGEIRVMLATRNISTAAIHYGFLGYALSAHDNRCNIKNGSISVIDLILGEVRAFNINRLISFESHGVINTKEKLEEVMEQFLRFKEEYEKTKPMKLSMDSLPD